MSEPNQTQGRMQRHRELARESAPMDSQTTAIQKGNEPDWVWRTVSVSLSIAAIIIAGATAWSQFVASKNSDLQDRTISRAGLCFQMADYQESQRTDENLERARALRNQANSLMYCLGPEAANFQNCLTSLAQSPKGDC